MPDDREQLIWVRAQPPESKFSLKVIAKFFHFNTLALACMCMCVCVRARVFWVDVTVPCLTCRGQDGADKYFSQVHLISGNTSTEQRPSSNTCLLSGSKYVKQKQNKKNSMYMGTMHTKRKLLSSQFLESNLESGCLVDIPANVVGILMDAL